MGYTVYYLRQKISLEVSIVHHVAPYMTSAAEQKVYRDTDVFMNTAKSCKIK